MNKFTITINENLRSIPLFSQKASGEVVDLITQPFILELIYNLNFNFTEIDIPAICKTAIYLNISTDKYIEELFWITKNPEKYINLINLNELFLKKKY